MKLSIVPLMMFFYLADFIPYGKLVATALFIFGAITDFLDGYIARKHNLVTDLGKFLDPIADKMLVTSSLILICCDGTIPTPYGAIVLALFVGRDLIINMLRQIASTKGVVIAAGWSGKVKTASTMIGLCALMAFPTISWLAWVVMAVIVLTTVYSGVEYFIQNWKCLWN